MVINNDKNEDDLKDDKEPVHAMAEIDGKLVLMERFILEKLHGINLDGKIVEHINGDTLDNRVANLRIIDSK